MDCLHGQCRGHRLPGGAMLRGRMHQLRPDRHPHEHELFRHGPDGQHQLQLSREGNGRGRQPQRLFQHRQCDHDGHDGRHHQVHPGQLCGPLFGDYSHRYFHSRPDCRKPECCCRWLERYYSYRQLSHRQQWQHLRESRWPYGRGRHQSVHLLCQEHCRCGGERQYRYCNF